MLTPRKSTALSCYAILSHSQIDVIYKGYLINLGKREH